MIMMFLLGMLSPAFSESAVDLMNEGKMLLYRGDIREGIRLLEQANRMDDKNLFVKIILAKGYSWNNEWERAKVVYGEVILESAATDQIHWEAKFGIAQITSWEKKYDEAIKLYQEILVSYKKISKHFKLDIGLAIGDIYSWKMENDKAFEQFDKLLAENPGNTAILNRIAKIYLWQGDYSESREFTEKVLAIDAKDAESGERIRVLDQIKTFTAVLGYDYTWYDSTNEKGENVKVHKTITGLDWQYSIPLKIYAFLTGARQNSIESSDAEKASSWNNDFDIRAGGSYRINSLTYFSAAVDYATGAVIFPDFSGEVALSRKLSQNIDFEGLYKFTYDKIDSIETTDSKKYHMLSPGIIIYYTSMIYNRLQFYVESDGKDLNYSVLIQQYLTLNPENIVQFYLFLSQGRTFRTYSDSTVRQDTTTYSASIVYSHFFNSTWGIEFAAGLTTSVNSYSCYHAGINGVYKW